MTGAATLDGTTAIVTGASSGIGRATAVRLASAGARVLAVGRDKDRLAKTCDGLAGVLPCSADLLDSESPTAVVEEAITHFDRIDVVVNNAGDFMPTPMGHITKAVCDSIFAINVIAPTMLTQAAAPWLRQTRGCIVNVTSTYGHKAVVGASVYAASKAALEHLTRCWALELAPDGVRVNAVAPGPTETPMLSRLLPASQVEKVKQREIAAIPLGRRGEADEIAEWIASCVGTHASWVTGQIIDVDGGLGIAS